MDTILSDIDSRKQDTTLLAIRTNMVFLAATYRYSSLTLREKIQHSRPCVWIRILDRSQ